VSKKTSRKPKPLYRRKPPRSRNLQVAPTSEFRHRHILAPSHFTLREDGSIGAPVSDPARSASTPHHAGSETGAPPPSIINSQPSTSPRLAFSDPTRGIWLYHGNCLELLDAIAAKYPEGRFDAIFADPPYFLPAGP